MTERGPGRVDEYGNECWIVETSKDGEHWRFFGRAWKRPGEQILLHAVPTYLRFRPDWEQDWCEPLERTDDLPMTLLSMEAGARLEVWPDSRHMGLPVLLPGGEVGRLLSYEHSEDPVSWRYVLEFRGSRQ